MPDQNRNTQGKRLFPRYRPSFLTRAATDDTAQLDRRLSGITEEPPTQPQPSGPSGNPHEPATGASMPELPRHDLTKTLLGSLDGGNDPPLVRRQSSSGRQKSAHALLGSASLTAQMHSNRDTNGKDSSTVGPKIGSLPRPVGGQGKLGTFSGVFVPTTLNVLSILMFLRFGFILGQAGVVGMAGMLVVSYIINLVTTLSISAIATNGTVRGGGAYYLISRSLGPEFGGSIGVVFYLGFVFNTGLNAVGLVDCVKQNFGEVTGNWAQWLPEGFWWQYLWATVVLVVCTGICLAGSGIFARCSNGLLAILLVATLSIPLSSIVMKPFESRRLGIEYTGLSLDTFKGNLLPRLTKGADGSQLPGKENFQDLFGILFPATGGIFAGASMSGDLKHPSKAIPKGTLYGLGLTFICYTLVILAMAATTTRASFYRNVNVIQDTNLSGVLVLLGEFATTFFSSLMGVIGSAKLLQALARDNLLPGFSLFGQGTKGNDEPTYAILFTFVVAQLTLLCDINQIASFVTMTYLMTFLVTNLACFLLKVSSAPNFRPSFHFFHWGTALFGAIISGVSMFFVDGVYASGCIAILIIIFLIIHYTTPPKSWGDVSQSLIYHQVRKYLLRLRQEHVKFWRPQILLFVNDPRRGYKLIQFCNSLKKGSLFILAHVIIADNFGIAVPEARRQQIAWTKYIDFSKIKAFVNIAISPVHEWGTRNIVLSAGLGGMRPNIVIMGFYNLEELRDAQPLIDIPPPQHTRLKTLAAQGQDFNRNITKGARRDSKVEKLKGLLPTDTCRSEGAVGPTNYVTILEDLLLRLQINVAIAKGFKDLEFPHPKGENTKKYIDLWPIQMSAEIVSADGGDEKQNLLTTNFDTYTLILQLGCILDTVPSWKKAYKLRVAVFVEYESDVKEERGRVKTLLENLRIQAEVLVFWLASGELKTYQVIVNGDIESASKDAEDQVQEVLQDEDWWQGIQRLRGRRGNVSAVEELADVEELLNVAPEWPSSSFQYGRRNSGFERFQGLKKFLKKTKRRHSSSNLGKLGVRLGMRTHRFHDDVVQGHAAYASASEASSSDDTDTDDFDGYLGDEASSEGDVSAASENDVDQIKEPTGKQASESKSSSTVTRRHSANDGLGNTHQMKKPLPDGQVKALSKIFSAPDVSVSEPSLDINKQGTGLEPEPETSPMSTPNPGAVPNNQTEVPSSQLPARPRPLRHSSFGRFTSKPQPESKVATEDGPGPSIMFTEPATPPKEHHQSIYDRRPSSESQPASGFPAPQSVPLSFNDLPCRAQHLILNELLQQHSQDTAVLFTTLPSPVEGTGLSEVESLSYLSDLEVLCQDLPPVLLVHSNSMTVTMNL